METKRPKIEAQYIERHFNKNANSWIPGYWSPLVIDMRTGNYVVYPSGTKEEAIEDGYELVKRGVCCYE